MSSAMFIEKRATSLSWQLQLFRHSIVSCVASMAFLSVLLIEGQAAEVSFLKQKKDGVDIDWKEIADAIEKRDKGMREALNVLNQTNLAKLANPTDYRRIRTQLLSAVSSREKLQQLGDLKGDFKTAMTCLIGDEKAEEITRAVAALLNGGDTNEMYCALSVLERFSMFKTSPDWLGLTDTQMEKVFDIARSQGKSLSKMRPYAITICLNLLERRYEGRRR